MLVSLLACVVTVSACGRSVPAPSSSDAAPNSSVDDEAQYLIDVAACLDRAGWAVEVDLEALSLSVPSVGPEQREAFMNARSSCDTEVGGPPAVDTADDALIREFYEQLIELKRCLEEEGFAISEPPSFETFLESWATGPWHPYLDITDPTGFERAEAACPQP